MQEARKGRAEPVLHRTVSRRGVMGGSRKTELQLERKGGTSGEVMCKLNAKRQPAINGGVGELPTVRSVLPVEGCGITKHTCQN